MFEKNTYTKVHCKIRYLIACTNCDRNTLKSLETELEGYNTKYRNNEIKEEEFEKLCLMVLKKVLLLHDLCEDIEWVN